MKNALESKFAACAVAALVGCAAVLSIATPAHALNLGEIGGGIYAEFGPDDGAGNSLGIVSESYDSWAVSGEFYNVAHADVPTMGTSSVGLYPGYPYLDTLGYMLVGLNPYTGEVVTGLDPIYQVGGTLGYDATVKYGYNGDTVSFGLRRGLEAVNPDYDVNWDVNDPSYDPGITDPAHPLYDATKAANQTQYGSPAMFTADDAQLPTYEAAAESRASADFIWFNSEEHMIESGWSWVFGSHINCSSDGQIASQAVATGSASGVSVSSVVDTNHTYLYNAFASYGGGAYVGDTAQPGSSYLGFTMDGIEGWIEIGGLSGHRSGVKLMGYYFDFVGGGDPLDIDGDGDVDADDIDALFTMVGGTDMTGDLDEDGDVDQDDVDFWVGNVPIGENTGTVYGDFNLDGAVDAGDLALLGGSFGLAGPFGWANGDATGDGVVDAGDLALLGGNFGTIVHPVPEPVTMSLLAVGACLPVLRRRNR